MKKLGRRLGWLVLPLLIAAYVVWALLRPLPDLKPAVSSIQLTFSTPAISLTWPGAGQSAVGIVGTNILETHGQQKPAPTASTAKIITALMVLKQKPLAPNQPGPTITITAADKAIFDKYAAQGGSVVPVQAGEQISQYQVLEAMLLPSANNMADSLATWAYGSLPAYSAAANAWLKQQGLASTTVGSDASGFSPSTTSTAQDLVKLGELLMQKPVLANIVSKTSTGDIPLVPNAKNVNFLLGSNGVVGIKTGNTDQAGGVFIGAAQRTIDKKPVTLVTALVGTPTLFESMKFSLPLIQSAEANFKLTVLVHKGDVVGRYNQPWGKSTPVVASQDLAVTTWQGGTLKAHVILPGIITNSQAGQTVSQLNVSDPVTSTQKSIALKLGSPPTKPTLSWRLTHPLP